MAIAVGRTSPCQRVLKVDTLLWILPLRGYCSEAEIDFRVSCQETRASSLPTLQLEAIQVNQLF